MYAAPVAVEFQKSIMAAAGLLHPWPLCFMRLWGTPWPLFGVWWPHTIVITRPTNLSEEILRERAKQEILVVLQTLSRIIVRGHGMRMHRVGGDAGAAVSYEFDHQNGHGRQHSQCT